MSGEAIGCHAGDDCDTISSTCTPIILLPGVMGSRLHFGDSRTWDPDANTSMLRWVPGSRSGVQINRAAFSVTTSPSSFVTELDSSAKRDIAWNTGVNKVAQRELGLKFAPQWSDIQSFFGVTRNWASVAWGFYGAILMRLEAAFNDARTECPVYACGYDWRKSNADSGDDFKAFLLATLARHPNARQCIVLTHSMGGFVVRAALAAGTGDIASKIRGVVHTVHPSNGSVACYTRFFSGVSNPVENIGYFDVAGNVLATVLGQTAAEFAYNMSGLPGPLQLLPNQLYQKYFGAGQWLDGVGDGRDLGDVYALYAAEGRGGLVPSVSWAQAECGTQAEQRNGTVQGQFQTHLGMARSFHNQLASAANAGYHDNTVAIYSTGIVTICSVRMDTDNEPLRPNDHFSTSNTADATVVTDKWTKIAYTRRPRGDGTVPDVSGKCPGAKNATVEPAQGTLEHSQVFANATLNDRIVFYVKKLKQPAALLDGTDGAGGADGKLAAGGDADDDWNEDDVLAATGDDGEDDSLEDPVLV